MVGGGIMIPREKMYFDNYFDIEEAMDVIKNNDVLNIFNYISVF